MFQVYASMDQRMQPAQVAAHARRAEQLGYDGLNVPEAVHDGLLYAGGEALLEPGHQARPDHLLGEQVQFGLLAEGGLEDPASGGPDGPGDQGTA